MSQATDSGHRSIFTVRRRLITPPSRLEAGFTSYDVLLLFVIVLTIWTTVIYINDTYYKNRPAYVLPVPESTHYRRETFRTGFDLREYPSYYAPTIISIDREAQVELHFQSSYDRFGNIWYHVRYYRGGRFYNGWIHALYLH